MLAQLFEERRMSLTTITDHYVFDAAWQRERQRLRSIEDLYDPASRQHLTTLGVSAGWRCLEVGCGAGSLARWLADRVGPTGHVLATDLDLRFMRGHERANLELLRHDIVNDPLEPLSFDLVHARALLMHLAERESVLARLVAATRPGGWVMIEDPDFGAATAAMLARYVVPISEA